MVSEIPVLVSPPQGKTVSSWPCLEDLPELENTLVTERRASLAPISSWEYKLHWLDSSINSDSMVLHKSGHDAGDAGEQGSKVAVGRVHSGAANCCTDSKEEVYVIGSPGFTPQSGDSKGGGKRISKTSGQ